MPVMSGREAFFAMKKIKPDVKVLLASGFKQDSRVQELLEHGILGFIQKPYTISKISRKLASILDN
jgi:two-component system, cell cycle sensor histidine kinase and response regulator CckA